MTIELNLDFIKDLITYFVPGYIFLYIYHLFLGSKTKHFEETLVISIVLSYALQFFSKYIIDKWKVEVSKELLAVILAIVIGVIAINFRDMQFCKTLFVKLGRITGENSIWYDFFNVNIGNKVRVYSKINNSYAVIEGNLENFEVCENDNECFFILTAYSIRYENGEDYVGPKTGKLVFNSKDVDGVETVPGKKERIFEKLKKIKGNLEEKFLLYKKKEELH